MVIWKLSCFLIVMFMYCNALPSFNNYKIKSSGNSVHNRINEFRHHLKGIKRMMKDDQNEPQNTAEVHTNHAKDINLKAYEKEQYPRHKLEHRQNSPGDAKNNAILGKEEFSAQSSNNNPTSAKSSFDQDEHNFEGTSIESFLNINLLNSFISNKTNIMSFIVF